MASQKQELTPEQVKKLFKDYEEASQKADQFNKEERDKWYSHFERYIVVGEGGKVRIVDTQDFSRKWEEHIASKNFANLKINEMVVKIKDDKVVTTVESHIFYHQWFSNAKRHDVIDFDPNRPYGSIREPSGTYIFNRWNGFPYQPDADGDAELFYDFLLKNICDDKKNAYEYVLDWMAAIFQKPAEKNNISLVFSSQMQGSGKSVFGDILCQLCKPYNKTIGAEELVARFNDFMRDKILIFVDENMYFQKRVVWNKLKKLISGTEINLEEKGLNLITASNHMRFVFAANEEVSVGLETDNRRYQTIKCREEKFEKANRDALIEQLQDGGYEKIMYDLLNRNIDGVDMSPRVLDSSYVVNRINTLYTEHPSWVWLHHCAFDDIKDEYDAFKDKIATSSGGSYFSRKDRYYPLVNELFEKYINWCRASAVYDPGDFHKFSMDIAPILDPTTNHTGGRKRDCSTGVIPETKMRLSKKILGNREQVAWLGTMTEIETGTIRQKKGIDEVLLKFNLEVESIIDGNVIEDNEDELIELQMDIKRLLDIIEQRKIEKKWTSLIKRR